MTTLLLLVKGTLLLAMAAACVLMLPRRAHALRHLVWVTSLGALLALPLFAVLPGMPVAVPLGSLRVVDTYLSDPAPMALQEDAAVAMGERDRAIPFGVPVVLAALPLATAWAAVAAAILLWLVIGRIALRRLLRRAERLSDEAGLDGPRGPAWLGDVKRRVALYRSDAVSMPMTWGLLQPVIVLPLESANWSEERRRVVLLHEFAHVCRRDSATQFMASVACALWWFHPLAWYAARRMRVEREHACDDMVLAAGTVPADYAAHLLDLARQYRASFGAPVLTLSMARPGQLEGRLLTVLAGPSGRVAPGRLAVAVSAVCTLALVACVGAAQPTAAVPGLPATGNDEAVGSAAAVPGAVPGRSIGGSSADIPTFRLLRRDGTVLLIRSGGDGEATPTAREIPLTALSETRFRDPSGQIYQFHFDAQGRVARAVLERPGPEGPQRILVR